MEGGRHREAAEAQAAPPTAREGGTLSTGKDSIYDQLERRRQVPPHVYLSLVLIIIALAWVSSGSSGAWVALMATAAITLAMMLR